MEYPGSFEAVLAALPTIRHEATELREVLLANLVMVGEIAAPTFHEEQRVRFLLDRFTEGKLVHCSTDDVGNATAVLPGSEGSNNILVVSHVDHEVFERTGLNRPAVSVAPELVSGPDVADNSLGCAALCTLPTLFERLGLQLRSSLLLVGAARSLGRGNLEGLSYFLDHFDREVKAGIAVEGIQLGQLCESCVGMARGELTCQVPEQYDWTRFGAQSAILVLSEILEMINSIALPKKPRTTIVLGSVEGGGSSFNTLATEALLRFEVRSESADMVAELEEHITEIAAEVGSKSGAEVAVDFFARRVPGGIGFRHPLARQSRQVLEALELEPSVSPSTSELSCFIARTIPAIRIGITRGMLRGRYDQQVEIEPCARGLAQLVGILLAIDGGYCDEE